MLRKKKKKKLIWCNYLKIRLRKIRRNGCFFQWEITASRSMNKKPHFKLRRNLNVKTNSQIQMECLFDMFLLANVLHELFSIKKIHECLKEHRDPAPHVVPPASWHERSAEGANNIALKRKRQDSYKKYSQAQTKISCLISTESYCLR